MAMPCENNTEACAELATASFEEVFDKSCQGISLFFFFSPTTAELPTGKANGVQSIWKPEAFFLAR